MFKQLSKAILCFFAVAAVIVSVSDTLIAVTAGGCISDTNTNTYNIYYHNSGLIDYADQDFDMDLPEFFNFLEQYPIVGCYDVHLIVDHFEGSCQEGKVLHGPVVRDFWNEVRGNCEYSLELTDYSNYCELFRYIINNYGRGTVVNLSNGPDCITPNERCFRHGLTPIDTLYDQGTLLVGAPLTFCEEVFGKRLREKVLSSIMANAEGDFCCGGPADTNVAAVAVCSNYQDGGGYYIARPGPEIPLQYRSGWESESGSFTTPLLAGCVARIMDIVASRPGIPDEQVVDKVLDYVISSCDRNVDQGTYARYTDAMLKSYGPWSPVRGYGLFNPWKAMIYAYGYGSLEAVDTQFDPGEVTNPTMVFSDHFYLRGDLFIPANQTLLANAMSSINIDPTVSQPEGPGDIGFYPSLQDILVAGVMEVETSLNDGVHSSLVIDDGGSCTIKDGGLVTISMGQILYVRQGGVLNIENGGELFIHNGGLLAIDGELNNNGTISYGIGGLGKSVVINSEIIDADTGSPTGGDSLMGCPEGDWLALKINLDFNNAQDGSDLSVSTDSLLKFWGENTADSSATSGNGYMTTITRRYVSLDAPCSGGCEICPVHDVAILYNGLEIGQVKNLTVKSPDYFGNGVVDLSDFACFGSTYGLSRGDEDYIDCFDFNFDQTINQSDHAYICSHYYHQFSGEYGSSYERIASGNAAAVILDPADSRGSDVDIYIENVENLSELMIGLRPGNPGVKYSEWRSSPEIRNTAVIPVEGENALYLSGFDMGGISAEMIKLGTIRFALPEDGISSGGIGLSVAHGEYRRTDGVVELIKGGSSREEGKVPVAGNYLRNNYPNPFNPSTTIEYSIQKDSHVNLCIYDVEGRIVKTLVNKHQRSNVYKVNWNGKDHGGNPVTSGIYFCRMVTDEFEKSRKLILLR